MLSDLDETIKKMLTAELGIKNGEVDIKFEQPKREWSSRLNRPTINFFLYDVRENVMLRQHQWDVQANGNGRVDLVGLKRTPFRLDCYYMITTWTPQERVDDEHRLLSNCLMVLFRNPILPADYLTGLVAGQEFEIQARVASHDKLTNPAEVWSALDNEMRPSISYLITIAMDPWQKIELPMVRSLGLQLGPTSEPAARELDTVASHKTTVGGQVRKNGQPQPQLRVALADTGFETITNDQGQYQLNSLPHGEYTLVVWPEKGKPRQKRISVPGTDFNVDL